VRSLPKKPLCAITRRSPASPQDTQMTHIHNQCNQCNPLAIIPARCHTHSSRKPVQPSKQKSVPSVRSLPKKPLCAISRRSPASPPDTQMTHIHNQCNQRNLWTIIPARCHAHSSRKSVQPSKQKSVPSVRSLPKKPLCAISRRSPASPPDTQMTHIHN
jgi:hypothetical protein